MRTAILDLVYVGLGGFLGSIGRYLATGAEEGGRVYGVHLVKVPIQTPLEVARRRTTDTHNRRT